MQVTSRYTGPTWGILSVHTAAMNSSKMLRPRRSSSVANTDVKLVNDKGLHGQTHCSSLLCEAQCRSSSCEYRNTSLYHIQRSGVLPWWKATTYSSVQCPSICHHFTGLPFRKWGLDKIHIEMWASQLAVAWTVKGPSVPASDGAYEQDNQHSVAIPAH